MMLLALYPTPTPFPAVAAWNGYENTKIDGIRSPTLDDLLVLLFSCLYSLMEGEEKARHQRGKKRSEISYVVFI